MKRARLWVGVVGLVLALGSWASAGPDEPPKGPKRPAWLVGIWETTTPEGEAGLALGADGTVSVIVKTAQGEEGAPSGTWSVEDGEFVQHHGGEVIRYAIERPPDEAGRPRFRMVEPGAEATAPIFRRRADAQPGLPRWMCGTWEDIDAQPPDAQRFVLMPSGRGRMTFQKAGDLKEAHFTWSMANGRLTLAMGEKKLDEEVFLDVGGPGARLRITLSDARVERTSWPPAHATFEGPLVGEWTLDGAPYEERLRFLPTGAYERRRRADLGTTIERGTFHVARGARGEILKLESAAGRRSEWTVQLAGGRLALVGPSPDRVFAYALVPGSPAVVARQAFDDAASEADLRARYRFQIDQRWRVPPPGKAGTEVHPLEDDPAPGDVLVGEEVFADIRFWVGESEELLARALTGNVAIDAQAPGARELAEPKSTRARRVSQWLFSPSGRVQLEIEHFGADGTAGESTEVHFGTYSITGDVITVQLAGQRERGLRLHEGGLFLLDGPQMLLPEGMWLNGPVVRPNDD